MPTPEELLAQIALIDTRLNAGAETVAYQGESVRFNFTELRRRREELRAELSAQTLAPRVRRILTYTPGKGL